MFRGCGNVGFAACLFCYCRDRLLLCPGAVNVKCAVYKSRRRANTYLYIEAENDFRRVPQTLLHMLGTLELVLTLELDARRSLARADPQEVRRQLREHGYYLQLPPGDFPAAPS